MTNIDSRLKSRKITLLTKVHIVNGFGIVNKAEVDVLTPPSWEKVKRN